MSLTASADELQLHVSRQAFHTPRSGIREVLEMALTMPDVIRLEMGEPSFATPAHIIEAAQMALQDGWTKYTPSVGVPVLREALAEKVNRVNGIRATPEQIVVTSGSAEGIFSIFSALCNVGDEILIPDPGWSSFVGMAHLARATSVGYPLTAENGFLPSIPDLERLVTPRTRLLLLNSPANPVGTVIGRERMLELLDFAERHDIWLLSDEAYDQLTFEDDFVSAAALSDSDRVITAHSFSKTYAMTGWRVGYLTLPKKLTNLVTRVHELMISCVSAVGQAAAIAALAGPQDCVKEMRDEYLARRDLSLNILEAHGLRAAVRPAGAFYLWLDVTSTGVPSKQLSLDLLRDAGVAVSPGTAFGEYGEGYLRLSFATETDALREGVDRIGRYLRNLH